jgi:predicted short-subunit dehydrogenase-like oxidoreductase (DUF2520 family)
VIYVTQPRQIAIVGPGRLGTALARRLSQTGFNVVGPLARGYEAVELHGAEVVLLCVSDREIGAAASTLTEHLGLGVDMEQTRCPWVGHCSGISTLDVLAPLPRAARFSLHPLMTFAGAGEPGWEGATAAISAATPTGREAATYLARKLSLSTVVVADADRDAYHAAASMASNFLITLELAAERLADSAGVERAALLPLVRATVENWARDGAAALTGPIARGDSATVARQRAALAERTPELLALFDALAQCTRELTSAPAAVSTTTPLATPATVSTMTPPSTTTSSSSATPVAA